MEPEIKNSTSENAQIAFKLSQDERQIIEESAKNLELNISEYCRLKSLMDENTVVLQKKKIRDLENEIKLMKVKLDFYKNSIRTPEEYIVLEISQMQRDTLDKMFSGFIIKNQELSLDILDALLYFYRILKENKYAGYEEKISLEEIDEVFNPELEED